MSTFLALWRQRLRRDGLQLALWILGTALLAVAGYAGVTQSYGTAGDRRSILTTVFANPVIEMFRGLPSGDSAGAFLSFEILPWLAILAALMSTFLAVRHTRADEELGRTELLAATPAGRTAPTVSTIVHGVAANLVLAVLTAVALLSTKLDAAGAWLTGAAAGATGIAFLGIALVAAQLMRTARGANSLAIWVLVGTFLLRGIGDATGTADVAASRLASAWPAWLSPFGWAEQTRPYAADIWWPALLAVAFGLALAAAATVLQSVRDIGAAFVAGRQGRPHARPALASSHALVWRMAAGSIVGWAVGGAVVGMLATTLGSVVGQVAGGNPGVQRILAKLAQGGTLEQSTVTIFFTMLGVLAACAAVQTVVRARQEETRGTAEPVRAAGVARVRWLAGYLIVATSAVVIITLAATGTALWGIAGSGGSTGLYRVVMVDALGELVAASVFTMLTAVLFVLVPRAAIGTGWALVLVGTMLGMFGPLFGLPEWTTHISPFGATPVVSGASVDIRGLWWLILIVVLGAAASLTLMRRRELAADG